MLNVKENRLSTCLFSVVMCASIFSVALGLVVLVGWHVNSETMVQVIPSFVPMQYNAALGFVLCGSGMLLAIFKKQYRGSITVKSEEGKGATFTVKLPIMEAVS